jgi:site-specific DNA-methyltransferase (adenine-specific)
MSLLDRLVIEGDCIEVMRGMDESSVDAVVCDPPYGLGSEPDIEEVLRHWLAGDDYEHRGGGFMGKSWDSFVPGPSAWRECFRVLKPGGHMLVFAGTRTADLMGVSIRFAGFEERDCVAWIYGSGFPKSLNVAKAIDKAARGVPQGSSDPTSANHGKYKTQLTEGKRTAGDKGQGFGAGPGQFMVGEGEQEERELVPEAQVWSGFGTALKPAYEPIIVARKPLGEKNVAANVLRHGTGALNIDGCRLGYQSVADQASAIPQGRVTAKSGALAGSTQNSRERTEFQASNDGGRWPANVALTHHPDCESVGTRVVKGDPRQVGDGKRDSGFVDVGSSLGSGEPNAPVYGDAEVEVFECHSDCPVRLLDEQTVKLKGGGDLSGEEPSKSFSGEVYGDGRRRPAWQSYGDSGGASRFFYCSKASSKERNDGLDHLPLLPSGMVSETSGQHVTRRDGNAPGPKPNNHPTVKPVALMRWLVRLVTPPGGLVLDPFAGSGTTGVAVVLEGFRFVGVEQDEGYCRIARVRIEYAAAQLAKREEITA